MATYRGHDEHEAWLKDIEESDVLVVKNDDDSYEVFKTVLQQFTRRGLRFSSPDMEYPSGNVMPSASEAIKRAEKVLLVMSRSSAQKSYSLEMFLALEKSLQQKKLCLTILLLNGFERENIPKIPMLQNAAIVQLQYNRLERCLDEVIDHIKTESPLGEILPAGNFSTGLAWSHYTGFLRLILPELPTLIRESEWYRNNPGRFPEKFFILLPMSAQAEPLIKDENIAKVGELVIKKSVDGSPRIYKLQVYSVTDRHTLQTYFICAEIPSAFGTIGKVFHGLLSHINYRQRQLEVERFNYMLNDIMEHQLNEERTQGISEIIMYNDEAKDNTYAPSYHLLENLKAKQNGEQPPKMKKQKKKGGVNVCLLYADCDKTHAQRVKFRLEDSGIKNLSKVVLPKEAIPAVEERLSSADWILLFMSQESLTMSDCFPHWMANILTSNLEDDNLRVLPILINASPAQIPDFIRWVTYLDIREEGYMDRIIHIVNGNPISMKSQTPVGNVAYGLSWAFFVNYLQHALPDLPERCTEKLREISAVKTCVPKLFEFIPFSCKSVSNLETIHNETFGIESFGAVKPKEAEVAGIGRVFNINMHAIYRRHTKPREYVYYFLGEFAAPIRTLRHMLETMISGLNNFQMVEQAKEFKEHIVNITNEIITERPEYERIKNACVPILYDDSKEHLIDVLMKEIAKQQRIMKERDRIKKQLRDP